MSDKFIDEVEREIARDAKRMTDGPDTSTEAVERIRLYVEYPYTYADTVVLNSALVRLTAGDLTALLAERDALKGEVARLRDYISEAPEPDPFDALRKCEAALADITEGEPETDYKVELRFCKRRADEALRIARAALQEPLP